MAQKWQRVEPTNITKVGWRSIVEKTFILPDGRPHSYTTVGNENTFGAAVVALTKDNQVIVVRQFRPGPETLKYDLPGGGGEAHETPEQTALRELEEETGYVPSSIEHLGSVHLDAYTNVTSHYFIAYNCELNSEQTLDTNEYIDVMLMPVEALLEKARAGEVTDVAALFFAYEKLSGLL